MARTVNQQEFRKKRDEILDAAMRLVLAKGYERMTIQDILADLKISSGAFYHYFESKPALLEAFVKNIEEESGKPHLPIVHDPHLSAIEKLRGFFATLNRVRLDNRTDVVEFGRVWYADDNAIVRQKVDEAILEQRSALLTVIVRQGLEEGVFATPYPDHTGEVVASLLRGMERTHARLLLSSTREPDSSRHVDAVVGTFAAYMDAIERVLGAPSNSLDRIDPNAVRVWVTAARGDGRS